MSDPEDKKIPAPESADTGNGEPPAEEALAAETDTGNGEPPPQ